MQTRMNTKTKARSKAVQALVLLIPLLLLMDTAGAAPAGAMARGKRAPGFNLNVLGGGDTTMRLGDLIGKRAKAPARLVVLSFFATWCKPCKAEMPILQTIHETLGPKGVKVLSVVVEGADDRPQAEILAEVKGWAKEKGVTFPILYDPFLRDVVAKRYLGQAMQLPGVYLITPDGRIKASWHEKRNDLKKLIEEHLR